MKRKEAAAARADTDARQLSLLFGSDPAPAEGRDVVPAFAVEAAVADAGTRADAQADAQTIKPSHRGHEPLAFRHPRAEREIRLGDVLVAYEFKRVRRRSIGMVVSTEGLSVRAPRWVGLGEIDAALRDKADWICAKLADQHERARKQNAARIDWRDGTTLPFMGDTVILVLDDRVTGVMLHTDAQALPGVPRLTLHVGLPETAQAEQIRDVVQAWLQRQALVVFEERCALYAQRLGVRITRLSLSNAQTRWGSASADGSIRLNWRLVHFGLSTIDYVVAHELAHLREMNHGPRFWDVVRSVIPDLDEARVRLRDQVLPPFE